jgi:cytidine deaminase
VSAPPDEELLAAAQDAAARAYAPYSKFKVGAAVLAESGAVYAGCNVENASYGLTVCAERSAVFSAVATEGPSFRLRAIAITTERMVPCSPCGACRQVISEFGGPHCKVIYRGLDGIHEASLKSLLPDAFQATL